MDEQSSLKWLADQTFQEVRALRSAEDNLFSWAMSIFLGAFGALTGLRGMTTASWSLSWRLLVILGLIAAVGVILLMAYLIRRNYDTNREALANIFRRLGQGDLYPMSNTGMASNDSLVFYLRWGGFAALGVISLFLVWFLG
jgi:hypothetical protein